MRQGLVPKKVFFTSGSGTHKEMLESFEMALRDAGIEKFNLVTVSSILPPKCEIIEQRRRLKVAGPGRDRLHGHVAELLQRAKPPHRCLDRVRHTRGTGIRISATSRSTTPTARPRSAPAKYAEKLAENMYYTWKKEKPENDHEHFKNG